MKFIELTRVDDSNFLLNLDDVSTIETEDNKTAIWLTYNTKLIVRESYEEVKKIIADVI